MAEDVKEDTLQGCLERTVWFHLDLENDVLYLRNEGTRSEAVFGEETPDGITILHTDEGRYAGMTVVNYWRRFGSGDIQQASICSVKERVTEWERNYASVA